MKKSYETPSVEVVKFQYSEQVVAVSPGNKCITQITNVGESSCTSGGGSEFPHD